MEVIVQNPNNIIIDVDQGRAGRGISSISYQQQGDYYYLVISYTDSSTQTLGPLVITGAAVSLLGGTAGAIAYQQDTDQTTFLPLGSANQLVVAGATAPVYKTLAAGTRIDVTASENDITVSMPDPDFITFDTTPETSSAVPGTLYWDAADGNQTLSLVMAGGNVRQQIGEETFYRIKATAPITEGQVVMFTGTVGASGALTGAPATGLTAFQGEYVMGIATENIALNAWGYVTWFGLVRGINTTGGAEAWVDGDILYFNPSVPGGLTKNVPSAPNAKVIVASVVHAATNGSIFVRPTFGSAFGSTDSNVQFSTLANGDIITYDLSNQYWKNVAQSTLTVGKANNLVGGAANQIPYQSAPNTTAFASTGTGVLNALGVNVGTDGAFVVKGGALGTPSSATLTNASGLPLTTGVTGILPVANGGTGANNASGARSNLGAAASATTISAGTGLSGGGDLSANRTLSIADTGVTAASYGSASNTLTATVNAQGQLTSLAATPIAIANTQVSGLGTMSTQNSNNVSISGGSISGITDLAIADGGTGASDAATARTNLGLGTAAVLNAGSALGVATLDAGGTVPLSQIPASIQGGVSYQGSWDASTNTPTIVSGTGSKGHYYVVSVAGSTVIDGISDWLPGDWIIFNGTVWEQIDNTDAVASVNGYTGVVSLTNTDVGAPPTSLTISAGTGLSGGGDLSANRTLSIANTTVNAGAYGSASSVATFTVNGQGQLTQAATEAIAISNTQVSGLGTMSTQNANNVSITGGSISGISALPTASGGTGLTSFTANGVVYASSTSALTTGSALTFDGTTFKAAAAASVAWDGGQYTQTLTTSSYIPYLTQYGWTGSGSNYYATRISNQSSAIVFETGSSAVPGSNTFSEQMRLTSTGLGIGTSSPGYKLDIAGTNPRIRLSETTGYVLTSYVNTAGTFDIGRDSAAGAVSGVSYAGFFDLSGAYPFVWRSNITERMRLDASGNLGLGVTPSAAGTYKLLQLPTAGQFGTAGETGFFTANAYLAGAGTWTYATSNVATRYAQEGGVHHWSVAPSGTAGNAISFTQAMTLTAGGNLGIGTTSPSNKLELYSTTNVGLVISRDNTSIDGGTLLSFREKNSAGTMLTQNIWSSYWSTATAGNELAVLTLNQYNGGAISEVLRIQNGNFITNVNGTAPTLSTNRTMSFELTSNTSLKIVVRGSDGVTRSVSLTLA